MNAAYHSTKICICLYCAIWILTVDSVYSKICAWQSKERLHKNPSTTIMTTQILHMKADKWLKFSYLGPLQLQWQNIYQW